MRPAFRSLSCLAVLAVPAVALAAAADFPAWLFEAPDPARPPEPPRAGALSIAGSTKSYTQAEIDDLKRPPDWRPDQHRPAPAVVTAGKEGARAWACGSCHLMSGMGHPESASLAGLPLDYLKRQMAEFRSGERANRVLIDGKPQNDPVNAMVDVAKSWSEAESDPALRFFAEMKPRPWVRVVEARTVTKSYLVKGFMRLPEAGGEPEALGSRIVELPEDPARQMLRDPDSGSVAYVPEGAVSRGAALAAPCAACHGPGMKGQGDIPALAGRSPTYTFRQLFFFQQGSRSGPMAAVMKQQVASFSQTQMIDLAAYIGSLTP